MKISVNMTVEIDPEAWMLNFGGERDGVRQEVREYVQYIVETQIGHAVDEAVSVTLRK